MASVFLRRLGVVGVRQALTPHLSSVQSKRTQFGFLDAAWNKVDPNRIKEVGAEKAAAEWLMRCGAAIKWQGGKEFVTDYNQMEFSAGPNFKIQGIDGSGSCITADGFGYLQGLSGVKSVKLNRTHNVDNLALNRLSSIGDTLEDLEVSSCGNVTDSGVKQLGNLKKLKKLTLFDLPGVQKPDDCLSSLKSDLPSCQIDFEAAKGKK